MEQYKNDRLGLVLAYWGLAVTVGRPQVSQTDYDSEGKVFGSVLSHISVGRNATGAILGRAKNTFESPRPVPL